jgi:hypothetical protein
MGVAGRSIGVAAAGVAEANSTATRAVLVARGIASGVSLAAPTPWVLGVPPSLPHALSKQRRTSVLKRRDRIVARSSSLASTRTITPWNQAPTRPKNY